MDDIIFSTSAGIKSSNIYNGLFSVEENGKYWLRILAPLKPIAKGNNLEFVTGEVDPSILGIQSSPDQIINLWEEYETKGFPLDEIAQSLYVVELMGLIKSWDTSSVIKSWESPHVTLLAEVIVLLESINKCKHIKGFDERVRKDKNKLLNIVESRNTDKRSFQKNKEVYEKLYALHNEYATASYIHEYVPIELTDDVGKPDFNVIDSNILIDAKMRLTNDKPVYKDPNDTNLTNTTIFSLLMKEGFGPLQSAFDEQNTDIAMVNLSISSYGFMLSTGLIADTDFRFTMTAALEMARNKEKAVIFYTLPRGTISGIFAVCFKRSIVDKIGGYLSRIDSEFYRLGNKKSFSEFASFVNGLKLDSLNQVNNGGLLIRDPNTIDNNC